MSMKTNLYHFAVLALLISACGSDKNEPGPEETVQSMSQLKATTMGTCPTISGRYTCIENCEVDGESAAGEEGLMLLRQRGQGQGYHFVSGDDNPPKDFIDYLISNYVLDDGGLIVDGAIKDKTAPLKNSLEALYRQSTGVAGHVLRRSLSILGIDLDTELAKIDIPNITAGYQAGCTDNVFISHYVVGSSAGKFKMKNISADILEVKAFILADGVVQSHKAKLRLVESVTPEAAGQSSSVQGNSMIASWVENKPSVIQIENTQMYSLIRGEYLNMTFRRNGDSSIYALEIPAFWGRENPGVGAGRFEAFNIDFPRNTAVYVDLMNLKVFAHNRRNSTVLEDYSDTLENENIKELGAIYETEGQVYIRLNMDCGWRISRKCTIEGLE